MPQPRQLSSGNGGQPVLDVESGALHELHRVHSVIEGRVGKADGVTAGTLTWTRAAVDASTAATRSAMAGAPPGGCRSRVQRGSGGRQTPGAGGAGGRQFGNRLLTPGPACGTCIEPSATHRHHTQVLSLHTRALPVCPCSHNSVSMAE